MVVNVGPHPGKSRDTQIRGRVVFAGAKLICLRMTFARRGNLAGSLPAQVVGLSLSRSLGYEVFLERLTL